MKRVVIAEDEKLIRQGIKAMVERSEVPVEEIMECKNGEEALEYISLNQVDVLITDIRMPKMDGVTLVQSIQKFSRAPKVIVISGYDDFSYAVELLRCGAREYFLKPVNREDIQKAMRKLQKELEEEELEGKEKVMMVYEEVRRLLTTECMEQEDINRIVKQTHECTVQTDYVVICTNFCFNGKIISKNACFYRDIMGHNVLFLRPETVTEFAEEYLSESGCGISSVHHTIAEAREALLEAIADREKHFFHLPSRNFENVEKKIGEDEIERMIQLTGTARLEEAERYFVNFISRVKRGEVSTDNFASAMAQLTEGMKKTYGCILDTAGLHTGALANVYHFRDTEEYYEAMGRIMSTVNQKMLNEYDDYRNRIKMEQAISYVRDNYQKDINMAMVSNEISMNYTAFSSNFKEYTGENFSNYLKDIRMKEAKRLLDEGDKKVHEISSMVGYDNEKHFMKSFKLMYGVTPTEYRKNIQSGRVL